MDGSAFDQLKTIMDALTGYFDNLATFASDDTQAPPMLEDVFVDMDYSEILKDAIRGENIAANFATGSLVDTVQIVISINREFSLRSKSKAQYYVDAESEYDTDSGYYSHLYPTYYNMFRGKAPEQT